MDDDCPTKWKSIGGLPPLPDGALADKAANLVAQDSFEEDDEDFVQKEKVSAATVMGVRTRHQKSSEEASVPLAAHSVKKSKTKPPKERTSASASRERTSEASVLATSKKGKKAQPSLLDAKMQISIPLSRVLKTPSPLCEGLMSLPIAKSHAKGFGNSRDPVMSAVRVLPPFAQRLDEVASHERALGAAQQEITELKEQLATLSAENEDLKTAVKNHAAELAKVEEKRVAEHDAWKAASKELHDLKGKLNISDEEVKSLKASLEDASTRYSTLEDFVLAHCRKILGTKPEIMELDMKMTLAVLIGTIIDVTAKIMAMLQSLTVTEQLPQSFNDVIKHIALMPTVVGWMRHSACRRGAAIALSLGMAHYRGNYDVAGVTEGFPPNDDGTPPTIADAKKMIKLAEPYADRILRIVDLNEYQGSQVAPEDANDAPPSYADFPTTRPFAAARDSVLTTYPSLDYDAKVLLGSLGL
ncbi:hypothetical protein ACQ4PT_019497 [Festuca glaucescens]